MFATMRFLATALLLLLSPLVRAAEPVAADIGSWRYACLTDRMTDATRCAMRHKDWVEPPSASLPGLALEVEARGGRLVPVVAARELRLDGAARGLLALAGTVQLRFPPNRMMELSCGIEGRSLVCAPRGEDAARAEQELPGADRALVRVVGLTAGSSGDEPVELRLAGTRDVLARFRRDAPPEAVRQPEPSGLTLPEIMFRLQRLFGG